eukprot:1340611-Rhodomonas_salina.1
MREEEWMSDWESSDERERGKGATRCMLSKGSTRVVVLEEERGGKRLAGGEGAVPIVARIDACKAEPEGQALSMREGEGEGVG